MWYIRTYIAIEHVLASYNHALFVAPNLPGHLGNLQSLGVWFVQRDQEVQLLPVAIISIISRNSAPTCVPTCPGRPVGPTPPGSPVDPGSPVAPWFPHEPASPTGPGLPGCSADLLATSTPGDPSAPTVPGLLSFPSFLAGPIGPGAPLSPISLGTLETSLVPRLSNQ